MSIFAAQSLWKARLNHEVLPRDFEDYPTSEEEAYAIQKAMISHCKRQVIGWKLGATTQTAMETIGVTRPFVGPLFRDFCYQNGDTIKVSPRYFLETEFTIKIKSNLPYRPEGYPINEVEPIIEAIIPSFEVIGSRFDGEIKNSNFRPIADSGANVGCVLGQRFSDWNIESLTNQEVLLNINGERVTQGKPSNLLWKHLFEAVSWLASQPIIAERGLIAGDLIMTGTMTGMIPVAPGDVAEANFGNMGILHAQFGNL